MPSSSFNHKSTSGTFVEKNQQILEQEDESDGVSYEKLPCGINTH